MGLEIFNNVFQEWQFGHMENLSEGSDEYKRDVYTFIYYIFYIKVQRKKKKTCIKLQHVRCFL